jgi:large subunit ribosomal protein L25
MSLQAMERFLISETLQRRKGNRKATARDLGINVTTLYRKIKDLQIDQTSDKLLHADLIQIAMDKEIRVAIPIELAGEAIGVKTEGGFVDFMTREVEIECFPANIPEHITIDISALHLHQSMKIADIVPPEGVKLISEPNTVIVLIQVPHEEKVEAKPEEEVVAEAPVEAAEPEVIKKERKKEEEEKEEK